MSPTIFRDGAFRYYFFSREEARIHVHVQGPNGEAKFWMEPSIHLAQNYGLNDRQLNAVQLIIEAHANEIREAWARHFGR